MFFRMFICIEKYASDHCMNQGFFEPTKVDTRKRLTIAYSHRLHCTLCTHQEFQGQPETRKYFKFNTLRINQILFHSLWVISGDGLNQN